MNTPTPSDAGRVHLRVEGRVATLVFDRPAARNAMTWAMYEALAAHCRSLSEPGAAGVVLLRGAGGEAFVAGTDIAQFKGFRTGEDGVAYEARIDAVVELVERLPVPTIAVVEGWAVGGGLALATACDFRVATPAARFGVPIARTLGNTLSARNIARLSAAWGVQRVRRMLVLAALYGADDALAVGFLEQISEPADIDAAAQALADRLLALAPVTQSVAKEALRRLAVAAVPDMDDLVRRCYGSEDFREGVAAFTEKRAPQWSGR